MEVDDIEFWIEPPLLLSIHADAHEIAKRLSDSNIVSVANELRRKLENSIRKASDKRLDVSVYSVDSSYVTPPLEMIGCSITILSCGYVGCSGGQYDKYVTGEVVLSDAHDFDKLVSRRAAIRERELAIKLLKKKVRGEKRFDVLIIDGELLIHPLPYNIPVEDGTLRGAAKVISTLVRLLKSSETAAVGVVKRVRSRYLSILMDRCLPANDKFLTTLFLRDDEYFVLGRFREILPRWVRINYEQCERMKRCKNVCSDREEEALKRRLDEGLKNLERIFGDEDLSSIGDIYVCFYKASSSSSSTKVEILNFSRDLSVDDILSYLVHTSTYTGYPFILDRVDEYVRVNARMLDYVRSLIIRSCSNADARMVSAMTGYTNVQKLHMYQRLEA